MAQKFWKQLGLAWFREDLYLASIWHPVGIHLASSWYPPRTGIDANWIHKQSVTI